MAQVLNEPNSSLLSLVLSYLSFAMIIVTTVSLVLVACMHLHAPAGLPWCISWGQSAALVASVARRGGGVHAESAEESMPLFNYTPDDCGVVGISASAAASSSSQDDARPWKPCACLWQRHPREEGCNEPCVWTWGIKTRPVWARSVASAPFLLHYSTAPTHFSSLEKCLVNLLAKA